MKYITTLAFGMFLASATSVYAQVWREIKPIESTCKDVGRLLNVKACDKDRVEYRLPNGGMMYVGFERFTCSDKWSPAKYNVPTGTVISVWASLALANVSLSDLQLDESKLKQLPPSDLIGEVRYESDELGLILSTFEGKRVADFISYPSTRYDHLLCSPKKPPTSSH
jgi:hypothetical protein